MSKWPLYSSSLAESRVSSAATAAAVGTRVKVCARETLKQVLAGGDFAVPSFVRLDNSHPPERLFSCRTGRAECRVINLCEIHQGYTVSCARGSQERRRPIRRLVSVARGNPSQSESVSQRGVVVCRSCWSRAGRKVDEHDKRGSWGAF